MFQITIDQLGWFLVLVIPVHLIVLVLVSIIKGNE